VEQAGEQLEMQGSPCAAVHAALHGHHVVDNCPRCLVFLVPRTLGAVCLQLEPPACSRPNSACRRPRSELPSHCHFSTAPSSIAVAPQQSTLKYFIAFPNFLPKVSCCISSGASTCRTARSES
jgi:hypothetical protein